MWEKRNILLCFGLLAVASGKKDISLKSGLGRQSRQVSENSLKPVRDPYQGDHL